MIKFIIYFASVFFLFIFAITAQSATLKGKVIDAMTHETVVGANVFINGKEFESVTNDEGLYSFKDLKVGSYKLEVSYIGFIRTAQIIEINDANEIKTFDIWLKEDIKELKEVQVYGKTDKESNEGARFSEKISSNVINVISAKTIDHLPDLNTAEVLKRVSGVSMVRNSSGQNSQAMVRGMPPRYVTTLINGTKVPSPDSKSRSVPLDIVPSELLARMEVIKALTSDLEGDAIGGTVNLVMKDAPDSTILNCKAALGYGQMFLDKKFQAFNSSAINYKDPSQLYGSSYSAKPEDFTRANLGFHPIQPNPDYYASLTFGRRILNKKAGFIVSGITQNSFEGRETPVFNTPFFDGKNQIKIYNSDQYSMFSQQIKYGINAKIDYQINAKNSISIFNTYVWNKDLQSRFNVDTAFNAQGRTIPGTGYILTDYRTRMEVDKIESVNLTGNHELLRNLNLNWIAVYTKGANESPDLARFGTFYTISADNSQTTPIYSRSAETFKGGNRIWQRNADEDKAFYLKLSYNTELFNKIFELKAGGMYRTKHRFNYANEYTFEAVIDSATNRPYPWTTIQKQPWKLYNPQGNAVYNPGNYQATENVYAYYLMAKTSFGKLQVLTGIRMEVTKAHHEYNNFPYPPLKKNDFYYFDPLPSVHFTYLLSSRENIRFSFYQAISRPNLWETVPYLIQGDTRDQTGNPQLEHSTGSSFDLRYEIYPKADEIISAGVFYKSIQNPIELAINPKDGSEQSQNFGVVSNYGLEVVAAKYFGNFGISGNYTFTSSHIKTVKNFFVQDSSINGGKNTYPWEDRPLEGQSKHLINLSFIYRNPKIGFTCSLVYSMQGRNIILVNANYGQDYYQQNYHDLGATIEKQLFNRLVLYGNFSNLLNSHYIIKNKAGDQLYESDYFKQRYLLGIKFKL